MESKDNIRNLTVIAHVDHGKTTLTDSLVHMAGVSAKQTFTDDDPTEMEKGITIYSSNVSLFFELDGYKLPEHSEGPCFLINMIDSPGHADFNSEVSAALRVTDGALVVVDCIEGVCVQTEAVLRQALSERVQPVLCMNKLDRAVLELELDPEECYQVLRTSIESVNAVISTYSPTVEEGDGPSLMLKPQDGSVVFGSALHKWGFSLRDFARAISAKRAGYLSMDQCEDPSEIEKAADKLVGKLWGDHFYDHTARRWRSSEYTKDGRQLKRGFCEFVLEPIWRIIRLSMSLKFEKLSEALSKVGLSLTKDERSITEGKKLMKSIMPRFLPMANSLLEMMITLLPSPRAAQPLRLPVLYDGPADDVCAAAIARCDPEGPLMMYVSKMLAIGGKGKKAGGSLYAYGRVFSGTVRQGDRVYVLGPDYQWGNRDAGSDFHKASITACHTSMGRFLQSHSSVPCGNTVLLSGLDAALVKTGTVTSDQEAHRFKDMSFSVSPVVEQAVKARNAVDHPKLVDALMQLKKRDPLCRCYVTEEGENVIAGAGELHLEVLLGKLREISGVDFAPSEPIVSYRETCLQRGDGESVLSKSTNKHNRVWISASRLEDGLPERMEEGSFPTSHKERAAVLSEEYGWDRSIALRRVWATGPEVKDGCCVMVDSTHGVQYLKEVRDSMCTAFRDACKSGPLCGERVRGVRVDLTDARLHGDPAHRNPGQLMPSVRSAVRGAVLKSKARLMEPIFLVNVRTHVDDQGGVFGVLARRRGAVVDTALRPGTPICVITAHLPVRDSFGFTEALRDATGGRASPQMMFSHWKLIDDDPYVEGTLSHTIVREIRKRKSLPDRIPVVDDFTDKL